MNWSALNIEQRREIVTKLANDGLSGSRIAAKLNTTRSAVIGFAFRNGIKLLDHRQFRYNKEKYEGGEATVRKIERKITRLPSEQRLPAHKLAGNPDSKPVRSINVTQPEGNPVPFFEAIDRNLCKWPLWQKFEGPDISLCCGGKRITGRPYCQFHDDIHHGIGTLSERKADAELERHAL